MRLPALLIPITIVFCFVLTACNKSKSVGVTAKAEKIEVQYIQEIKLSALIDSIHSYVPLQTDETPLIGRIDKIIAADSAYFILDKRFYKGVLKFNKQGLFLNTIGSFGEGNGEYGSPMEIVLNKNMIEVFDGSNFSVLQFGKNGQFKEELRIPYWVNEAFQFSETEKIIYCPTDYSPDGEIDVGVVSIVSNDFEHVKKTFFPYEEVLDDAPFSGLLSYYSGAFTYVKTALGEFYTVNKKGDCNLRFVVDFGKYRWPIDKETMKSDQEKTEEMFFNGGIMSIAHRLCESGNYLTFHTLMIDEKNAPSKINDDRDRWLCIVDKSANKLYAIKTIINDIDGLPFAFPISTDGEYFLSVLSSELFKDGAIPETSKQYPKTSNTLAALNKVSNPVLVKFKFRIPLLIN
ncbi:MAG: 6-bladed beta-propeller [Cyclobacteriaceae bacterium]